uniref:PH01B031C15.20 protein n=1 Tax=Phyllostachys edulis TaxID=38705 RepID=L0P2M3_PHYED|nr:PH01B031C15.20 [Phyllostachys edulis]
MAGLTAPLPNFCLEAPKIIGPSAEEPSHLPTPSIFGPAPKSKNIAMADMAFVGASAQWPFESLDSAIDASHRSHLSTVQPSLTRHPRSLINAVEDWELDWLRGCESDGEWEFLLGIADAVHITSMAIGSLPWQKRGDMVHPCGRTVFPKGRKGTSKGFRLEPQPRRLSFA